MVSPARRCAFAVLRRTFEQGAYADRALRAQARRAGLEGRDLALATRLAFGAVQRRGTLDHLIETLTERPVERLDPPTRAALRLGLFQLGFLDAVPHHAAVDESVQLAKASRGGGHRLVNAVLRRAAGEARPLLASLDDATPQAAAVKHSHPEWVARLWWEALGPAQARALMAAGNRPGESALRANTLVTTARALARELEGFGAATRPAPRLPEGLVVESPFDAQGSPLWEAGALMPQSRASMLVSRIVAPRPGERVLDLCAAPGAKATHLGALTECSGEVVAVERRPARARELADNARRMRARNLSVRVGDARDDHGRGYDRVLVDAPCSGLGTLAARPDLRWRVSPEAVGELNRLQRQILVAAVRALRPGGVLVYSTCTISPRENELQVQRLLADHPRLRADDLHSEYPLWKHPGVGHHLLLMPHRDATQGFFIARLRRGPPGR
ncbi:MAG: 16S rRNA (cytosine(967)-C(5))-methyltransferase RsmB [Solirubrobacteraceae bacterium]